jgi:hypothetical protein
LGEIRVADADSAKLTTEEHLKVQYGTDKIQDITYFNVKHFTGAVKDVWEIEGEVTIKTGTFERKTMRFKRAIIHFKLQIDSITGDLMGFEE